VPDRLLGRVAGVSRTLGFGSIPLGAALGGAVGQVAGLPAVFLGAVGLSLALVLWVMRAVPQHRVDEADRAGAVRAGAVRSAAVPAAA
jgi:predicted MFS family arabinose efflux permease